MSDKILKIENTVNMNKKPKEVKTRPVLKKEYDELTILKRLALKYYKNNKVMLLDKGRMGELELCYLKNWKICVKTNNPGFDAKNDTRKIQIKVHFPNVPMIGKQAGDSNFDYFVVAFYDKHLKLTEAHQISKKVYNNALIKVQKDAKTLHDKKDVKKGEYKHRNDISYSVFKSLKPKKIFSFK